MCNIKLLLKLLCIIAISYKIGCSLSVYSLVCSTSVHNDIIYSILWTVPCT